LCRAAQTGCELSSGYPELWSARQSAQIERRKLDPGSITAKRRVSKQYVPDELATPNSIAAGMMKLDRQLGGRHVGADVEIDAHFPLDILMAGGRK
jgi:hypothetical protein